MEKKKRLFLKLRGEIVAKGYTQKSLACEIGITEQALNDKLKGKTEFTLKEIIGICNILDAPVDIFFEPKLHNLQFIKNSTA
jgi:transcriptional regulator with XRE-family HTH domain